MAKIAPHEGDHTLSRNIASYSIRQGTKGLMSLSQRTKRDACQRYLQYLRDKTDVDIEQQGFIEALQQHFASLPTRYALDVHLGGTEILRHKQLLEQARTYPDTVAFVVREIEVILPRLADEESLDDIAGDSPMDDAIERSSERAMGRRHFGLRPSFPSSSSLQTLGDLVDQITSGDEAGEGLESRLLREVVIAAKDRPQLLSRITKAMSEAELDVREAHLFTTNDGFSFDVFVVDSLTDLSTRDLEQLLSNAFHQMIVESVQMEDSPRNEAQSLIASRPSVSESNADDWEIDLNHLRIQSKIAASTFGHVYKGQYYGSDVAIKIIKDVLENPQLHNEFMQEVSIMKKVRNRNVVQFIGASTVRPNLCILFEYMEKGSVHDYLRKGPISLLEVMKIALDVARGMDYLHRLGIIHRDLKTANLLIDGTDTVKIADFGVAKIMDSGNCCTAETGTYRWMAPEVIEHREYDHKVDVYSFGILLWELLTGEIPYQGQTPIQAAVSVVQKGLRPPIPVHCPVHLGHLMHACWTKNASSRPEFSDIVRTLQGMLEAEKQNMELRHGSVSGGSSAPRGILNKWRRPGGIR